MLESNRTAGRDVSASQTDAQALDAFADELFRHWREGDFEFVNASFAPDGILRVPALGLEGRFSDLRPVLEANAARLGPHWHDDVRRSLAPPNVVIEQHVTRWKDDLGRERSAEVCSVVRLDDDGRIAAMNEYVERPTTDDPRQRILATVQAHVESEFTNDVDEIMATVSTRDVFFPVITCGVERSYEVDLIVDTAGARDFYRKTREKYSVLSSLHLMGLSSDWYTVRASVGTLQLTEAAVPGHAGLEIENPSVVIFPVATDGIIGEIPWTRYQSGALIDAAAAGSPLPLESDMARQIANARQLRSWFAAWQAGDVSTLETMVAERCCWVSKVVTPQFETILLEAVTDREQLIEGYRSAAAPVELLVVAQLVTDWYAVAELRFRSGPDGPIRRLIATYPFDDSGRLIGELSYGIDGPD